MTKWVPPAMSILYQQVRGMAVPEPCAPELGIIEPTGRGVAITDLNRTRGIQEVSTGKASYEEGSGFAWVDLQKPTTTQEVFKGKAEKDPYVGGVHTDPRRGKAEAEGGNGKMEGA